MSDSSVFNEDYYENGIAAGVSNYESYSYKPELSVPFAAAIKQFMGMKDGDTIHEIGCAKGFIVHALRTLGLKATGEDISEYAIANCHPDVVNYVSTGWERLPMAWDYILSKDCLEHLEEHEMRKLLAELLPSLKKLMLIIVPLAKEDGGNYVCPKDEGDVTHKLRWTLPTWISQLESIDRRMVVAGSYYIPQMKQANVAWEKSCGFLTIRRL